MFDIYQFLFYNIFMSIAPAEVANIQQPELFFDTEKDNLRELFTSLGREQTWTDELGGIVDYVRQRWVGKEHGTNGKDAYTPEQEAAALPILRRMGFYDEVLPPIGSSYDQIDIIGGFMRVNHERISFVKNLLDSGRISLTGPVVFWAGQRLRDEKEAESLEELMDSNGRYYGADVFENKWVQRQTSLSWESNELWWRPFASETELARLGLLKVYGADLTMHRAQLQLGVHQSEAEVPSRLVVDYRYKLDDKHEMIIMNARAVQRKGGGVSRHTTVSCAEESLAMYPPKEQSKLLLVSGNPHTQRTAREVRQVLAEHDRGDVTLEVSGPAAGSKATLQLVLGEVGSQLCLDAEVLAS